MLPGARLSRRAIAPLFILILVAALTFALPFPREQRMVRVVTRAAVASVSSGERAVIVGNSVIQHVSKCDKDRRNVAGMLADALGEPVMDLSYGGQSFEESTNLAAMSLRSSNVSRVFLMLPIPGFGDVDDMNFQTQSFFRLAAGPLAMNDAAARFARGVYLSPGVSARLNTFTYKGKTYPDYNGIKTKYFEPERQAMPCPEIAGRNPEFMEAYYWLNLARSGPRAENLEDVRSLAVQDGAKGRLTIVLMPIDFPDTRAMPAELQAQMARRRDEVLTWFRARDVEVIDATGIVDEHGFADRYCVCGHLTERGRSTLVKAVATQIAGAS